MKKILFALNQSPSDEIEQRILKKYTEVTGEKFTFDKEYYLSGVKRKLQENNYDVLILKEDLESTNKVTVEFLDEITDKYDNLLILFVVNNEHQRDDYIKKIFNLGIYNILYKEDLTLENIVSLITNSKSKKEAKIYLDIDEIESIDDERNMEEIPDEELFRIFEQFQKSTPSECSAVFDEINKQYNEKQILFLISLLSDELLEKLIQSNNMSFKNYYRKFQILSSAHAKKEAELSIPLPLNKIYIGVAGVAKKHGATHTAIGIASYLSFLGKKVAIVELNDSQAFKCIQNHQRKEGTKFTYNNIDFYGKSLEYDTNEMFNRINNLNYDYVVLDLGELKYFKDGSMQRNDNYYEMLRTNLQILCLNGALWEYQYITYYRCDSFAKIEPNILNWNLVINLGDSKNVKYIKKDIKSITVLNNIFEAPIYDPFYLDDTAKSFFGDLLQSVIPSNVQEKPKKNLRFLKIFSK